MKKPKYKSDLLSFILRWECVALADIVSCLLKHRGGIYNEKKSDSLYSHKFGWVHSY